MGYDLYVGDESNESHALSVDERLFDSFVEAHQQAIPPFRLVSRMNDPYGDANYAPGELAQLLAELNELARLTERPEVRELCRNLRKVVQLALDQKAPIFGRGD